MAVLSNQIKLSAGIVASSNDVTSEPLVILVVAPVTTSLPALDLSVA
jgi:hypothetical protein